MQYKKSDYIGETRPDIRTVRGQRRGKTDLLAQESMTSCDWQILSP